MIINVYREQCDTSFGNLPDLQFPNHEIAVIYMYAELNTKVEDVFVTLSCTLVDRDMTNPRQEIASFFNTSYYGETNALEYKPTQLVWYKMQSPWLSDCYFDLKLERSNQITKLAKINIKLQIREVC